MSRFGDRAPPPPKERPRNNYRAKVECPDCGVAAGQVHLPTCGLEERFIG